MKDNITKLIIIRGPSGSGKSTVAKALMEQTKRPTVLVDLDYYRFCFVNPTSGDHDLEFGLSESNIAVALNKGFDVIFEGNFRSTKDDPFFKRVFAAHPVENYLFYLDVDLEETLHRHQDRADQRITASKMKELYQYAKPTGHEVETIISQTSSLEQTVEEIKKVTGINNITGFKS